MMTQGFNELKKQKQLKTSLLNMNCLFRLRVDFEILQTTGTVGERNVYTNTTHHATYTQHHEHTHHTTYIHHTHIIHTLHHTPYTHTTHHIHIHIHTHFKASSSITIAMSVSTQIQNIELKPKLTTVPLEKQKRLLPKCPNTA